MLNIDIDNLIENVKDQLKTQFAECDDIALYNQNKVLEAFRKNKIALRHFNATTGYGYDDAGRDTLNRLFADTFGAEDALVSPYFTTGTHTISTALFGLLRPGDTLLSISGAPYDTLIDVISGNNIGSLKDFGIDYRQVNLTENGKFDNIKIKDSLQSPHSVIYIQRSRGYSFRNAFTVEDIENIIANINTEEANNSTDKALKKKYGVKDSLKVEERIPFSSAKKCSTTVIGGVKYYLGALEYITEQNIGDYEVLDKYVKKGYRIITLAKEKNTLEILAFVIIKDNIRPTAGDTLRYFKEQSVEIKIISGDNPSTVSNILKQLDFEGYDRYIEGKDLPNDYNELQKVVKDKTIFGRMTPIQKQMVIKALKEENTVGMIGDGVNDILALKEADCGIALGSGVSAARSVSDVVLKTDDFAVLPSIVNEGRRVVNNIERVASMYLIKTTYSFLLCLLSIGLSHEYPFYPIQLSLISATCVGIPSFFLALEPNYNKVGKDFLMKVFKNAVPNGITVVLNIFIIIMFCSIFNKSFESYRLVVVTLTGFITLRLLYTICKPLNLWRKILLIFCSISFFELLILLPDLFLVSKFDIVSIIFIATLAFIDTYIIDFLSELFEKIVIKIREVKNEKKKKESKLS